jgi:hypothetical protein
VTVIEPRLPTIQETLRAIAGSVDGVGDGPLAVAIPMPLFGRIVNDVLIRMCIDNIEDQEWIDDLATQVTKAVMEKIQGELPTAELQVISIAGDEDDYDPLMDVSFYTYSVERRTGVRTEWDDDAEAWIGVPTDEPWKRGGV